MRIVLFGASGMVGQGALRECLLDPRVVHVAIVVRRPSGYDDAKLDEIVLDDLSAIETLGDRLEGSTPASIASVSPPSASARRLTRASPTT